MRAFARRALTGTAAALVIGALAGCSAPTGSDDRGLTVLSLQERVYTVSTQIAEGDTAEAAESLEDLEQLVGFSSARGTLSAAEADEIRAAIDDLRSALG
ncbi:hypothetical protein [Diaminobutyricimonas aerilata]|uniref:hypothetical protein n=1 Tax=Diaminobutyricimonas aerilata TaxID=1162967 RepID=UPI000C24AA3F|nr:hypothetical protein [Diaminobutyricimonas aerilata]